MKYPTLLALTILAPWNASAQTAPDPVRLPTITVTPSGLNLTEPRSVTELPGEEVRLRSIERIEDLQSQAPNVVARSGGSRSLNMVLGFRGMVNNAFYGEPAVGLYVDDVPYGTSLSYDATMLDASRVDILRGPQFTRWGRQGPAGVIAIYTEPPGERFGVRAEAGLGNYDARSYKLRLDGPIGSNFAFSASGMYSRRDGFLFNELKNVRPDYEEGFNGRINLQWQPTEQLQVKFIASAQHYDDGVQRFTNLDDTPFTVSHDFVGVTRTRSDVQSLQIRYAGRDLLFTSITSRRSHRIDPGSFDLDFSPAPILPLSVVSDEERYSQEFRFEPTRKGDVDWFIGAYASHSDLDVAVDDNVFLSASTLVDKTLAIYGDITRKFDNGIDVTLGLRGEYVEKSADRDLLYPTGVTTRENLSRTISNVSPKLGIAWHASDDLLFYGNTSISYRSGAYSLFNFQPTVLSADTERTWANEIGAKARFLNDELEVSLAAFWYEISDYQIERYILGGFGVFTADEVVSRGVELEMKWKPVEGLELSAGVGYVDAQFRDHRSATGEDLAGNRPPYIPDRTVNLGAQYRHESGIIARADWLLTGRTFFDDDNTQAAAQSSYGIFNLRLGYEKDHWGVYLYGRNLTDAEYYTLKIPSLNAGIPGEPRTVGMLVKVEF